MIVIIDYRMGNLGSILNMLKKIDTNAKISCSIEEIENSEKLILPGVGSFDSGMENLNDHNLIPLLNKKVIEEKIPVLGICLGMQLFAKKSEEGVLGGLGWINSEVKKFKFDSSKVDQKRLKIPHMGWNTIEIKKDDAIFQDMTGELRFYFVHSYHFVCNNKTNVLATSHYGYDFPSVVRKENIVGFQFHPEKSHKFGMKLLHNFVSLC